MITTRVLLIALPVVGLVGFATGFSSGWAWRGDRAEVVEARQQARSSAGAVRQVTEARATEHRQAETMANIGAQHEEDRTAAKAVPTAVVADLRSGNLRLRDDLATCHTARLSEAAAGAVQRDAGAQLREDVAGALVQVARDADDQLRACQAVIRADRAEAP